MYGGICRRQRESRFELPRPNGAGFPNGPTKCSFCLPATQEKCWPKNGFGKSERRLGVIHGRPSGKGSSAIKAIAITWDALPRTPSFLRVGMSSFYLQLLPLSQLPVPGLISYARAPTLSGNAVSAYAGFRKRRFRTTTYAVRCEFPLYNSFAASRNGATSRLPRDWCRTFAVPLTHFVEACLPPYP